VSYYGGRSIPFLHERSRAPLMLHFGAHDPIIPPEQAERIRAAHPGADSFTYAAGHGFNCEMRGDYDAASAQTALDRTLAFLRTHLAPGAEQGFELDPRLAADARVLCELPLSRVLLVDDARFPWLILVPRRAACRDLIDLTPHAQRVLLGEVERAARALRTATECEKLNVASLGNQVAQLHVHVVARHGGDAAWPRPIWGAGERVPYASSEMEALLERLRREL
jgi:diadenosine tetraphosphate (Ap4A) HIT family hydrolase